MNIWAVLFILICVGAIAGILIGFYLKAKKPKADDAYFSQEDQESPTLQPSVPLDLFKEGFGPMWGSDVKHMMKVYAVQVLVPIAGWIVCYLWGLYLITVDIALTAWLLGGSSVMVFVIYFISRLYFKNRGHDKITPLKLIDIEMINEEGNQREYTRAHLLNTKELSKEDFEYALIGIINVKELQIYRERKKDVEIEIEALKKDRKVKDLTRKEVNEVRERLKFKYDALSEIQAKLLDELETPINQNIIAQIKTTMEDEELLLSEIALAHPNNPARIFYRFIALTKTANFIQHLGDPEETEVCLYGHSFTANAYDIDLQVRFQGENLVPVCQVVKSKWLLQHPKEFFERQMIMKVQNAFSASNFFNAHNVLFLQSRVNELMKLQAEKGYTEFNKKAEIYELVAQLIKLNQLPNIKIDDKIHLTDTHKTILISVTSIVIAIIFLCVILYFMGVI